MTVHVTTDENKYLQRGIPSLFNYELQHFWQILMYALLDV